MPRAISNHSKVRAGTSRLGCATLIDGALVRRRGAGGRNTTGGALLFAVSFLVLFVLIGVPALAFVGNMSAQLGVQADVNAICLQTAGVVDDQKYWLEAPRPGFDQDKGLAVAKAAATAMCRKMNLDVKKIDISFETTSKGSESTGCAITVDARRRFPMRVNLGLLDMTKFFPGTANGSANSEHCALPPYALIHMDAPHGFDQSTRLPSGFNERDVAVIPSFGFFYKAVAGSSTPATPYGKGLANGLTPENFMAMNHFHLKKSDVEYVMQTSQDFAINSWHAERMYDDKPVAVR